MSGLVRAEWLRFRKRRSLQVIVLAVPILIAFFFVAAHESIYEPPVFDPVATRAMYIADGYVVGLPPDEAEVLLAELIDSERANYAQMHAQVEVERTRFAFPHSIVTVLGNSYLVFFALILLTATTIGDEFSWGTIRTALLASSHRRRMLLVRLAGLGLIAIGLFAALVALGTILPALLAATGAQLPGASGFEAGALGVLLLGEVVIGLAVIAFAAFATLMVRSGSLTLVVALVYMAVEAAVLVLLLRFETFQDKGASAWVLDALPVRGIVALTSTASHAAAGLPGYEVVRDLGAAGLPLLALALWGTLFAALAFRRFSRMDIVE